MAIDSKAKRASIVAIGLCAMGPSVVPSGTFGQAQRQTVGYGYYGVLAAVDAVVIAASGSIRRSYSGRPAQTHLRRW